VKKRDYVRRVPIRVARFFFVQHTKMGKTYSKLPQNIPNDRKIYQMDVK
jgi:hypothetical protein